MTPLLLLENARIDARGQPLCDGLDCRSQGARVGLVGDWSALFALLSLRARLVRGKAEVMGEPAERVVSNGVVGLALRDPARPPALSGLEFLELSARLAGLASRPARARARAILEELGLEALGRHRLGDLGLLERRGLSIAHALLLKPQVIAVESPLLGLDERSASMVSGWLEQAASGRRLLVSLQNPHAGTPERALLGWLDELLVLDRKGSISSTAPSRFEGFSPRYTLLVAERPTELVAALAARGLAAVAGLPQADGSTRLWVTLRDPAELDQLRDVMVELEVPVFELSPLDE